MRKIPSLLVLTLAVILFSACSQTSPEWTSESISKKSVSWTGSYKNSKKLALVYHGTKFYNENGKYEWAFRVKVTYPKNQEDDTLHTHARKMGRWAPPNTELCIPVNKIIYGIYDKDDFLIDSMSIEGECVMYQDTFTFQRKGSIDKELLSKYKYGKVNIQAGYNHK